MFPISKHSVLFEFPKESNQQILKQYPCGYIQNILSFVIMTCLVSMFSAYSWLTETMWLHFTQLAQIKYTDDGIKKYWAWEIVIICWVSSAHFESFQNILTTLSILWVLSNYTSDTQYILNILNIWSQFPKLSIFWSHRWYILFVPIG